MTMKNNLKRIVITGGAGFIGSNLCRKLLKEGAEKILIIDDLSTGKIKNIEDLMELDEIENRPFVPEECMETDSIEAFYEKLDEYDHVFKEIVDSAAKEGKRVKYVATMDHGKASSGLETYGPEHPFYELAGKDNIVLFQTQRYPEQPLVVKGAGAGAAVTASGIFADVMRITSA